MTAEMNFGWFMFFLLGPLAFNFIIIYVAGKKGAGKKDAFFAFCVYIALSAALPCLVGVYLLEIEGSELIALFLLILFMRVLDFVSLDMGSFFKDIMKQPPRRR